ncbi:MAG: L,D-transpeptidase family protein [Flavobacteriales bacterium]
MDRIIILLFLLISSSLKAQTNIMTTINNYMIDHSTYDELLYVSITDQKLYHVLSQEIIKTYNISSSRYGQGNTANSKKTPLGVHIIKEKYGKKTPINGRMIGRIFYGDIAEIYTDKKTSKTDDITSRILWLEGTEQGKNKGDGIDSYKRYIYIHGTSEEGLIGQPASHGCIRMKNKDVIDLFKEVSIGTFVLIL